MGEALIELAKKLGIFMIISQTILHFGIGRQYEKYLKLIIAFMILAQLVSGFISFLTKNPLNVRNYDYTAEGYYEIWEENIGTFESDIMDKQGELENRMKEELPAIQEEEVLTSPKIYIEPIEIR